MRNVRRNFPLLDFFSGRRETDGNRVFAPTRALSDNAHQILRRHYLTHGDGQAETRLTNIVGVNGINAEFIAWLPAQVTDQLTRQDNRQVSMVSHFRRDRATPVGGVRDEEFTVRSKATAAQDAAGSYDLTGDFGAWGAPAGKKTKTYGAVVRVVAAPPRVRRLFREFQQPGQPRAGDRRRWQMDPGADSAAGRPGAGLRRKAAPSSTSGRASSC